MTLYPWNVREAVSVGSFDVRETSARRSGGSVEGCEVRKFAHFRMLIFKSLERERQT